MDYIEKEPLCAWLENMGVSAYIIETIKDEKHFPSADVVEVKHGEWIYHECVSSYEGAISGYSCSECCAFVDESEVDTDSFHKEYCGNCGAKMDGKKEGLKV